MPFHDSYQIAHYGLSCLRCSVLGGHARKRLDNAGAVTERPGRSRNFFVDVDIETL